ncbi:biotin carboxylase N-terminal domain-containing protein, partial [Antrihabitans sp. YC2-6]|uniref:ATP-binding protein n=1 Tax=Antrihabitans sp. YC2-6 TaxID=2799498 RepID=UPI0018F7BBBF
MFKRIAIVNRGEAAVRLIRAVRELNAEHNQGIRTIALHTEAERRAMFVRQADESVTLRATGTGSPYLDHKELERALLAANADAVWVGWGFVAEDPAFADLCAKLNITFIGPTAAAMRLLGDKVEAKILAEKVGVPVAPWSGGPVETRADARRHAQAIGYPLIIKARSGGGGRGIRKVYAEDELELALERTQGEAERSFGDPVVFIERLVTDARHVEVQVIADNYGNVWAPGVRDCSIQRKNQKVIEESSSPVLTKEQADHLRFASAELVHAAGYRGAGTVEYLYQPDQQLFTFLEVNTRLQVEHPITEATTGLDLVKLQIHVASGGRLEGECPPEFGHAVEARLNAEDADNGFAPAPGTVQLLKFPLGSGLRVDTGIAQGDVIPPDYDSMVAKVIAWGRDRSEALARLRTALRETTVVLHGGTTTKSFLLDLLDRPELISGEADTGWLDRTGAGTSDGPTPVADVALIAATIDAYDAEEARERSAFLASARGGRPRATHSIGRTFELNYQSQVYELGIGQIGPRRYRIDTETRDYEVDIDRLGEFESRITLCGKRFHVVTVARPAGYLVEVDGVSHQISQDDAGVVRAPAPAVVVALNVAPGDEVAAGQTLVVLEAMKMETAVRAAYPGRVREVLAAVNSQIDAGAPLLRIDQIGEAATATSAPRVHFNTTDPAQELDALSEAQARLNALLAMLTGFDVSGVRGRALLAGYDALRESLPYRDPALVQAELGLLTTFADICELSRNRPGLDETDTLDAIHSPREHFHKYLQTLDVDIQGLPNSFRERLSRVLSHYDINDLERTPLLEEAVYRLFLSQQRVENQAPVIAGLLERWLTAESLAPEPTAEVAEVLDRLIDATQVRHAVIGDVARNVRFKYFDEPAIRAVREQTYDSVRGGLQYLVENPGAADYVQRIDALADCSEPLIDLLAQRISNAGALLEVVTRQYYRIHPLRDVKTYDRDERLLVTGVFDLAGDRINLVSTATSVTELATTLQAVDEVAGSTAENVSVDLYLSWDEAPEDGDQMVDALRELLLAHPNATTWRRITTTVVGHGSVRQVTLRRTAVDGEIAGLVEDRIIRDMHPLTAQRLDMWRLKNFDGTPIPSPADTYLYQLAAKDNPADQRLIAFAEVRAESVQHDANGNIVAVPAIERAVSACMDGIRRAQAQRSPRRFDNNRVVLYLWPLIDLPLEKLPAIAKHIAPITVGAGLEEVALHARLQERPGDPIRDVALRFSYRSGAGVVVKATEAPTEPLKPLDEYTQKVQRSRARGTVYPYELIPLLTGEDGHFTEYDLDETGRLAPIQRPYGANKAGIIVGLVTTPTLRYPEGMTRVALFGDPTKALGTVAEAECS